MGFDIEERLVSSGLNQKAFAGISAGMSGEVETDHNAWQEDQVIGSNRPTVALNEPLTNNSSGPVAYLLGITIDTLTESIYQCFYE